MEIRNCTPHVLNIIKQDGEVLDLLPCGIVPRCSQSEIVLPSQGRHLGRLLTFLSQKRM